MTSSEPATGIAAGQGAAAKDDLAAAAALLEAVGTAPHLRHVRERQAMAERTGPI